MKREDFIPKKHSRICGRHFLPSAYYPFSRMLLPTAIPYTIVFNFPTHLQQKPIIERRPLKRIEPPAPTLNKIQEEPPSKKVKLPPSEKGLMSIIEEQEKKIKTLQQNTPMNDIMILGTNASMILGGLYCKGSHNLLPYYYDWGFNIPQLISNFREQPKIRESAKVYTIFSLKVYTLPTLIVGGLV